MEKNDLTKSIWYRQMKGLNSQAEATIEFANQALQQTEYNGATYATRRLIYDVHLLINDWCNSVERMFHEIPNKSDDANVYTLARETEALILHLRVVRAKLAEWADNFDYLYGDTP